MPPFLRFWRQRSMLPRWKHRDEQRGEAHIFLCLLAYYLEWHMRKAWAPLLFEDGELGEERKRRAPILPAKPSESAQQKKRTLKTADGFPVHNLETLMAELASRARVTYTVESDRAGPSVQQVSPPPP